MFLVPPSPVHALRGLIRIICGTIALVFLILSNTAQAQSSGGAVTFSGQVRTVVVTPASLVNSGNMDFGKIAYTAAAGTVVLNPTTNTCAITGVLLRTGPCQAATFVGMGITNFLVRINTPNSIQLTGPGAPMTLNNFTRRTAPDLQVFGPSGGGGGGGGSSGGNPRYSILPSSGIFNFAIGGTLNVNALQAPGVYSGTFTISVVYQ